MTTSVMVFAVTAGIAFFGLPESLLGQPATTAQKVKRANELIQAGKPDEAIPIYQELVAAFPSEPAFGVNLAIAQYKAGRYRDAIAQCGALLKRKDDLFPAWLFLGASQFELGDMSNAAPALQKALALEPADLNARVMLGDALLEQGQPAEAAAHFEEAAEAMPDNPRVLYGLGRSYEALAKAAFLRLEEAAPGSPDWLALGGDVELDLGQYTRAFQRYRLALKLRPAFGGIHTAIALLYERTGHPDWAAVERQREPPSSADCQSAPLACEFAAGHLREILSSGATNPEEMYWQSKAWRALSQRAYTSLQELPPSPERFEAAAGAYESNGRYPEAAAAWRDALQLSPRNGRIQQRLALALCRANDCRSALPIIEDLLARDSSSAALNLLYGTALDSLQEPGRALRYLETAVKLDGHLLPARAALAEAYLKAGKPALAIPQLEAAMANDDDGRRHYQLGRAYQMAGKQDQAAAVLREYREILRRRETADADEPRITPP
jgi:tetratricopeptide (TPR) repeat protein